MSDKAIEDFADIDDLPHYQAPVAEAFLRIARVINSKLAAGAERDDALVRLRQSRMFSLESLAKQRATKKAMPEHEA